MAVSETRASINVVDKLYKHLSTLKFYLFALAAFALFRCGCLCTGCALIYLLYTGTYSGIFQRGPNC